MSVPKLSVIIPVYKSEPYIDACLESLRTQTLRDIEIICINDGSPDGSLEKIRKHAAQDSRIIVIDQENQGPAIARNAGLDRATGEYIGFLDSDDYIDPDYFESMVSMAESHDADILLNNHVLREEEKGTHLYKGSIYTKQLPEGEYLDNIYAAESTVCLVYAHLYRGSLIRENNVRFQAQVFEHKDDYFHEDEFFHRVVHFYAGKVFAYSGPNYHYVARPGSIMDSRKRKNIAYVRCFSALRDYFGDRIYDKDFRLKLFCPMLYTEISDQEELDALKEYLRSIEGYISKSGVYVSDFNHFVMKSIMDAATVDDYYSRIGKYPYVRYQTRIRMSIKKNPAVSVIIPVYNTEKDLAKCLESVCTQLFRDMEIICVNDCSTDGSADIIRHHAIEDVRIKLIDLPQNAGVSNARNKGLDAATGKYIFFIDSDDWIDRDHIGSLVERIEGSGAMVATDINYIMEHEGTGKQAFSSFDWVPEEGGDIPSTTMQRLFPPVVWASIYRRDYIESCHIRFPEVKFGGEDVYFAGVCNLLAGHVHAFRGPYYHYRQRQGSLVRSKGRGFEYLRNFRMMRQTAIENGASLDGAKLFYVESLFIEDEEMFNFMKSFMLEIREEVEAHPEIYTDQDRFLMDIALTTPDYAAFKARYNPNISMSFIRSRMAARKA